LCDLQPNLVTLLSSVEKRIRDTHLLERDILLVADLGVDVVEEADDGVVLVVPPTFNLKFLKQPGYTVGRSFIFC
jgi:hypothetical protein